MASAPPNGYALVYGGNGALGSGCVAHFKANNWWVASVELCKEDDNSKIEENCSSTHVFQQQDYGNEITNVNKEADANILVHIDKDMKEQEAEIAAVLEKLLEEKKLDAIICVAGGFSTGNAETSLIENAKIMWQQNVWPAIISASLAVKFLQTGGLLCLPGAKPALEATPDSIAYGLAKAAVHQLTKSLASEGSGLPENTMCLALLPVILDTAMNRQAMPKGDISAWTPTKYVTDLIIKWSAGEERPKNGSFVQLVTRNFITEVEYI